LGQDPELDLRLSPIGGEQWRPTARTEVLAAKLGRFTRVLELVGGPDSIEVKAEPLSCRQFVQWQIPTRSGSPRTEICTCPQRHVPENIFMADTPLINMTQDTAWS
jgi:hypothetical protein